MSDLVPVHGGRSTPVNTIIPLSKRKHFLAEVSSLPTIRVDKADLAMLYRCSDGTLSPLTGTMDESTWHHVLETNTLEYRFEKYAWTIPLSLPLSEAEASQIENGSTVALQNENGDIFGILKKVTIFSWDKFKFIQHVYGTERTDHPGAAMVLQDERTRLAGGEVWTLPQPVDPEYGEYLFSPLQTRLLIQEKKWQRALAFQTRNPLHRAHEYALVAGVERLTKEYGFTGVVLNPLVGELKSDDVPAKTRMKCYERLVAQQLLGKGDKNETLWENCGYDVNEVFRLIGLDIKMFYGGPKEAVMHAIYRQNHGFSDLVIGRKHADAPYYDGTAIWGDFDAQEIFQSLDGKLEISPCNIGFAAYYESLGRVDLMENHAEEKPVFISGSKIRAMLQAGEIPDPRIIRPEISELLIDFYQSLS